MREYTPVRAAIRLSSFWPLVLTILLAAAALFYPSRVWTALLWAVGGVTALGYYWARQMARAVSFRRELRTGWMQVGDRLEERFEMANRSWLPVLWGEVSSASDLPGYTTGRVASCDGQSAVHWTTTAECTRRGVFTLGPWTLRLQDPFGLFVVSHCCEQREVIVVYPPVVHLPEIVLPKGLATGASRARWRPADAEIEAAQTRSYRPGDPLRQIHWPLTAHHGALMSRDAQAQVSGDLWIVLDLDQAIQAGQEEESTEEYGVILAASLADRTLRQNRAVGLAAYGDQWALVPLGRGKAQLWRILRALAMVRAGGSKRLADVLSSMGQNLRQGTAVLAITPSCQADWPGVLLSLAHRGIEPTAVLLDPDSFAGAPAGKQASWMQARLADAGIASHVIRQGYPFRPIVPLKRRGHWEFKVTPLGRAVAVRRPGGA